MQQPEPLFFHEMGDGPALLILHGFLGVSDHWVGLGRQFARNFRVIIPDLRNHGRSPWSSRFCWNEMADDILGLIDSLDLSEVSIIGHSMGGRLAMRFALACPQRIARLEVVDIFPFSLPADTTNTRLLRLMHGMDLSRYGAISETRNDLSIALQEEKWVQFCQKNIRSLAPGRLAWKPNLQVLSDALPQLGEPLPTAHRFSKPTLFLRGQHSPYCPEDAWPAVKNIFQNALLQTVPEAGHWIHYDNPTEFLTTSVAFLTG